MKDAAAREAGYRDRASMMAELMRVCGPVQFCTKAGTHEMCVTTGPDDLEHCIKKAQTPEMAEAMEQNGVLGETVHIFILDKAL